MLVVLFALSASSATDAAERRVVDDFEQLVVLDAPATRIVSLAPHITELLFAIGAGEKIAAVVRHSDYPAAARALPRIGEIKTVNFEALIALQPDLVLAWHSGNGAELIARLRELGLRVYASEPRALPDIAATLSKLGRLTGHEQQADAAAAAFLSEYTALRERYAGANPVRVFYQVWNEPLVTLNGRHLVSNIIRLCGGENVFAAAIPLAPKINIEAVVRANPQVIIASGAGDARPAWLDMWDAWPSIDAVRDGQLYFVPPDLLQRHTPRILAGARLLCAQLEKARTLPTAP